MGVAIGAVRGRLPVLPANGARTLPNPIDHYQLTATQAEKVQAQLRPMREYLDLFVSRLRQLNVSDADPLLAGAIAAANAVDRLSESVSTAIQAPPRDGEWR